MSATLTPTRRRRPAQARRKRVDAIRGKYAHVRTSSTTFAQAKQSEIIREARRK
jgi:hypothetical protein